MPSTNTLSYETTLSYISVGGIPVVLAIAQNDTQNMIRVSISWSGPTWERTVDIKPGVDNGVAVSKNIAMWQHVWGKSYPAEVIDAIDCYCKALSDRASREKLAESSSFIIPKTETMPQINVSYKLSDDGELYVRITQEGSPYVWSGWAEYCKQVTLDALDLALDSAFYNRGHPELVPLELKRAKVAIGAMLRLVAEGKKPAAKTTEAGTTEVVTA